MKKNYFYKTPILLTLSLFLNACSMGAGHVPRGMEVLAPVVSVANGASTALYKRKIEKLNTYISQNYEALKEEIAQKKGVHLDELILLVQDKNALASSRKRVAQNYAMLFENARDVVMRMDFILRQSSQSNSQTFLSPQIRDGLLYEIQSDFDGFRVAVKNKNIERLQRVAEILSIPQQKRASFYENLHQDYSTMFIESVSVRVYRILNRKF